MFCSNCGKEVLVGNAFCATCGTKVEESTVEQQVSSEKSDKDNLGFYVSESSFLNRLLNGDYGLVQTFWLYVVGINILMSLVFGLVTSSGFLLVIAIGFFAFRIVTVLGVFRASIKYKGAKIWSTLAKILTILSALTSLVLVISLVSVIFI